MNQKTLKPIKNSSKKNNANYSSAIKTLVKAGAHLGHYETNPRMLPYIYGQRNLQKVFNLKITFKKLYYAKIIIDAIYKQGGTILFVCTRPILSQMIKPLVPKNSRIIFIGHKWVGGTLTNWDEIIKYTFDMKLNNKIKDLKKSKLKRFYNLFTPFLRLLDQNNKQTTKLNASPSVQAPSLVVLFHGSDQIIPVREAKKTRTPVISIVDTNADPKDISYLIPGNDDNVRAQYLYARTFFHGIPSNSLYLK